MSSKYERILSQVLQTRPPASHLVLMAIQVQLFRSKLSMPCPSVAAAERRRTCAGQPESEDWELFNAYLTDDAQEQLKTLIGPEGDLPVIHGFNYNIYLAESIQQVRSRCFMHGTCLAMKAAFLSPVIVPRRLTTHPASRAEVHAQYVEEILRPLTMDVSVLI